MDESRAMYYTMKKLENEVSEIPQGTLENHLDYIGEKHTYGSSPKRIYSGHNLIVYTQKVELPMSGHIGYERITGVYKR